VNELDEKPLNRNSFSFKDIQGQDKWEPWPNNGSVTVSFATATSLTITGRFKVVGRQCFFQVKSTGTSLATTAGTSFIALPITAAGFGGMGQMSNDTTNISVGSGHIDVSNSRFYPPTQSASGNDFIFSGWYEI
jgi:hypothetical protein